MTTEAFDVARLHHARPDSVDIVDVPDLGYFMVDGRGAPDGAEFGATVQALYSVSYTAHFLLKEERGEAPAVRPLEALWWVGDRRQPELAETIAPGAGLLGDTDRDRWQWRAMICQPDGVTAELAQRAIARACGRKLLAAGDRVRFERWAEGRCAQTLHVGPYADEGPSMVRLHRGIELAGCRPHGRHHEIYFSDPRRTAPERIRTLLRQPVVDARRE
jgi:hypothetical protein